MRSTPIIRPSYADKFRCIGPACEDSCCIGWRVDIDQATFEKYQSIPAGPLRVLIDANIHPVPIQSIPDSNLHRDQQRNFARFAQMKMTADNHCPFHNPDRLCQIQLEQGESYLSRTCASYPRASLTIDTLEETTLSLSCPEAARLVLTDPNLLAANSRLSIQWDEAVDDRLPPRSYFWLIRDFAVTLLRNRSYPLWQRMFLLGTFARRMEALLNGETDRSFPSLLLDFQSAIATGALRASIETIPADLALQLDMVLRLVNLQSHPTKSTRLSQTIDAFLAGIDYRPTIPLEHQCARYADAYQYACAPFFAKHPHLLENYLLDMTFKNLFPFGAQGMQGPSKPEPAHQFTRMAIEFALTKGMLIGVASARGDAFSIDDALRTIQTVVKHFEHNVDFLPQAQALLVQQDLDNPRGLTMLLRN